MKTLVIDDEAPIRLLCRVNLEAEGIEVLEAAEGESGLELAKKEHPDVILLDVMMPGLDGVEGGRAPARRRAHEGDPDHLPYGGRTCETAFEASTSAGWTT